jgi:hypothetical protein
MTARSALLGRGIVVTEPWGYDERMGLGSNKVGLPAVAVNVRRVTQPVSSKPMKKMVFWREVSGAIANAVRR